jgi:hypothetical protein
MRELQRANNTPDTPLNQQAASNEHNSELL